ncbi:MAG: VWA domain-containing protein, partial [Terriglobia bacterium]
RGSEGKVRGEGSKGRDAAAVAYGGLQGTILGAAIGGKKGAAYGGLIGAGVGLLGVMLKRGPDLELSAGTRMDVELTRELAVPAAGVQRARIGRARALPTPTQPADPYDFYADSEPAPEAESAAKTPEADSAADPNVREETETDVAHNRTLPPPDLNEDPTLGDPNAYRLRVNVQLVLVEAVVRAPENFRHPQPLGKLTREDFRLFEDGAEQTIRHFSRDQLPLAVALVVDTSGSVAPYIRALRRAALEALSQLKRDDQVALFVFTDRVDRLVDLTTDRRHVARRIQRLRGEGGTNILDALWEATNYLQWAAPERRRAIILVSDNRATVRAGVTQNHLIRNALEADTVIYSIKTPGEQTPLTLRLPIWLGGFGSVRKITQETGGEIIDVNRVGSVSAALRAVVERLKTRYTLGYHPTNKARDGRFRKIEVRLTDRFGSPQDDYLVFAKRGYYAPRDSLPADNRAAQDVHP